MPDSLAPVLQIAAQLGTILLLLIDLGATCHIVLYKRDTRAAIAWVGFIWLVPLGGSFLYLWLGINRIRRRARSLRRVARDATTGREILEESPSACAIRAEHGQAMFRLARAIDRVTGYPLVAGNTVEPRLRSVALPEMLRAMDEATQSISLATYIFDNDEVGRQFVSTLQRAQARGVAVRVLVDDVGSKYSWPTIVSELQEARIPHATFLPRFAPWAFAYANLRLHRKLLIIDGRTGFTGGMNIRQSQSPSAQGTHIVEDLHFRLLGPIVAQLQRTFLDDWQFTTGETLAGQNWWPPLSPHGEVLCRGIPAGPDEHFDNLRLTIQSALSCAERRVMILTPYFLPDRDLIAALNLAALRGVEVDICLPANNNLRLVSWATNAILWQILQWGCRVWLIPGPFDHTKLMLVDDAWTMLGSANWDTRSLRLNFEFNVECYDRQLNAILAKQFEQKRHRARRIMLEDVDQRPMLIRLRDGLARLLSPYL